MAPGQYELTQGDPPRVVALDANTSQQVEAGAGIPAVAVSGTLQNRNWWATQRRSCGDPGASRQCAGPEADGV